MKLSNDRQQLGAVVLLLLWCLALLAFRMHLSQDLLAVGLLWNLLLAAVPLFWASALRLASERGSSVWAGVFFCLWLLFLPNAPYILTDLVHLGPRPNVPLWYVLAMLLSCAGAGTLLGYVSLLNVQALAEQKFGPAVGWAVAVASLLGCGFGIYLGRFLRWNSWDAFTHPIRLSRAIVGQFIDSGPHPHPVGVTLIFGVGLIVGYVALRAVAASIASSTRTP